MKKDIHSHSSEQRSGNLPAYLTESEEFQFSRLTMQGIDNMPVLNMNGPAMADEEICLFHRNFVSGDEYIARLHDVVKKAMINRQRLPAVRFADGEYAFYKYTLGCNGLYRQAESVRAIREAMPLHIDALRRLAAGGKMAPLIFPGNIEGEKKRGFLSTLSSVFRRSEGEASATSFLNFLFGNGIELTGENYLPFYAIYAYLTSESFARLVDGRKVCILNADCNPGACREWFTRFGSKPEIVFAEIPAEYIATQWGTMRDRILERVPPDAELCLIGAGVGALPLCVDIADHFSIPTIDAGHVLNMMNGREDKSNGARLFTIRKPEENSVPSGGEPAPL